MKSNKQYEAIIRFICKENDGTNRLAFLEKLQCQTLKLLYKNDVLVKIELYPYGFIVQK